MNRASDRNEKTFGDSIPQPPCLSEKYIERKITYSGETKIFECRLIERNVDEVVILYELSGPANFLGLRFSSGSKSYGYYWSKRNYNVYHWISNDKKTIVYYFNISKDTKILDNGVEWSDMIVDIAAFPDGRTLLLDEEEIPGDVNTNDLKLIELAKKEILLSLQEITGDLEKRTMSFIQTGL